MRWRALIRPVVMAVALLASGQPGAAWGHPTWITMAHAVVQTDGSCRVTLQFDLLAFVLNDTSERIGNEAMEALLAAPRDERERALREACGRFERSFAVVTEQGVVTPATVHFPSVDDVTHWRETAQPVLPVTVPVEVSVRLPADAQTVAFRFPGILAEVILTVERPGEDFFTEPVAGGKTSTVLPVRLQKK